MSIEIEVGLENATKAPRITEEELRMEETPKGLANPRVKRLLFAGGTVVVAAIAALFVYYHNRETTDDAQVDGHITPMASKVYGRVAQVLVEDNQAVKAGQVLVKIDPRDYQAALDQAKASLALAESEARSAEWTCRGRAKTWRAETPARMRSCWARRRIWRVPRLLTSKRRRRIWLGHKRTWKRAVPMPSWRKQIWRVTCH